MSQFKLFTARSISDCLKAYDVKKHDRLRKAKKQYKRDQDVRV